MKTLIVNGREFRAEKIVKSEQNIIGYDLNNNEVFALKGISDFTGFQLQDENGKPIAFEPPSLTDSERITATEEAINTLMSIM